jgi:hypothetical protein
LPDEECIEEHKEEAYEFVQMGDANEEGEDSEMGIVLKEDGSTKMSEDKARGIG